MKKKKLWTGLGGSILLPIVAWWLLFPSPLMGAVAGEELGAPPLIAQMLILTFLALLPWLVILLTSYLKMVVVLSILRQAMGVQNSPPNQVLNGIAILLAVYVMFPTGYAMYQNIKPMINSEMPKGLLAEGTAEWTVLAIDRAKEPMRQFLIKNSNQGEQRTYYRMATKFFPPEVRASLTPNNFLVLIPAYITSQVQDAFQIGVLIYLPFFVVDLVTSNILLAMGMMMLSPMTISLPLKLLLLVMMDGWSLVLQGLLLSFKP